MTDESDGFRVVDPAARVIMVPRQMPAKIAAALVKAAREADAVEKKGTVSIPGKEGRAGYSYTFAGADALMSEARGALEKAGLAIVLTRWWPVVERHEEQGEDGKPSVWFNRTLFAEFLLVHEEGESHPIGPFQMPVVEERGRGIDKCDAAALTYLTGYTMRGLLCLPRVEKGSQVDERDDSERVPRGAKKAPTAEEAAEVAANAIAGALSDLPNDQCPTLEAWCSAYASKANRAIGMERLRPLVAAAATRLEVPEAAWQAFLAKAVAASKR